jgi:3-methyladenine DNA glycosylase AlkD
MARFGITPKGSYGVVIPELRKIARETGVSHPLALRLWESGIHEARILASMIDSPEEVAPAQMEKWAREFDSWDVCDQCCSNLFDKTRFAYRKAAEWSQQEEEFVKRAGFVLMAALAVHDKRTRDDEFVRFLAMIEARATDDRNFVKKAINWALRQIGKRNPRLNQEAVAAAKRIQQMPSPAAKWIASDALRELTSEAVRRRLQTRKRTPL